MIVEKKIKMDENFEVPVDMVTDMKLTCRNWEKMRKKSGLDLTDKERIAQMEMAHTHHSTDIYHLEHQFKMLEIIVLIIAIGEVVKSVLSILAR